jgi:hypothetical protein
MAAQGRRYTFDARRANDRWLRILAIAAGDRIRRGRAETRRVRLYGRAEHEYCAFYLALRGHRPRKLGNAPDPLEVFTHPNATSLVGYQAFVLNH